jgi:integrase/recombinase XerD
MYSYTKGGDMAALGKQAKVLTEGQIKATLAAVTSRRYPERNRVMALLSVRAGPRAKEIAMVTDARGDVGDCCIWSTASTR